MPAGTSPRTSRAKATPASMTVWKTFAFGVTNRGVLTEGAMHALDLFREVYGRSSFDGAGAEVVMTVHYGRNYDNAFWNGTQLVFGDGDRCKGRRTPDLRDPDPDHSLVLHVDRHSAHHRGSPLVRHREQPRRTIKFP